MTYSRFGTTHAQKAAHLSLGRFQGRNRRERRNFTAGIPRARGTFGVFRQISKANVPMRRPQPAKRFLQFLRFIQAGRKESRGLRASHYIRPVDFISEQSYIAPHAWWEA